MSVVEMQGLSLLREYDKFVCKAVYSDKELSDFLVYNDFIKKMHNEAPEATVSLLDYSGMLKEEVNLILDFCKGYTRLSACREVLFKFFNILVSDSRMLDHMLDLRHDNDVCLYMLEDIPRNIKDRLIELNISTATELAKYIISSNKRPYGISPRLMYKLFDSIRSVSRNYDVVYLRQCYESITTRSEQCEIKPDIDFYNGILTHDLYILYTISRKVDIYNLNDAIALIHAFRRFISTEMVDKLLNCFGNIIPKDIKQFTRSMLMIDNYIAGQKGMRLSQFQSLVVRSAYYVSKILDKKRIQEILVKAQYGQDVLSLEYLDKEKQVILRNRLPNLTAWDFQEYIRKNSRIPVDVTFRELNLLYSDFAPDKFFIHKKWFDTFITDKNGFPVYVLS